MAGSTLRWGACACVCEQPCPGVGVPPRHPPVLAGEEGGHTFVTLSPLPGKGWWDRRCSAVRQLRSVKFN